MENNPFTTMVQAIRDDNKTPAAYRIGTVKSISPLEVDVAGTIQDHDSLLKNEMIITFEFGDRLLLIPIDDEQRYIILCKVVDA
jgi:hypothetical protein